MRKFLVTMSLLIFSITANAQHRGGHEAIAIDSKVLGEKRNVMVRLPATYATGTQRYPVIVMTDGDAHMGHTAATVDFLVRNGRMPESIIVGISNTDRTRDLTPTHVAEASLDDGQTFRFPTSGGAEKFLTFIATELLPHIDENYRTLRYRVFMGHSFGGLFALHAMTSRPKLFNAWVAVSPTLNWDNRYVARRVAEFVEKNPELDATLFVTVGNEGDVLKREFDDLGKAFATRAPKGFNYQSSYLGDEDHGSVVLPSHYAGLRAVFADWRFSIAGRTDPKQLWSAARSHYEKLSSRVGAQIQIPEATANVIGYRLLMGGNAAGAIEVFRANVDAWPKSANVYDSLGEAYERSGDIEKARENYERAWKRGKETKDPNTAIFKANFDRVAAK
jgi:predicted alpha/beta superfamily hydrolase